MAIYNFAKKQLKTMRVFKAYGPWQACTELVKFPYDLTFGKGKSHPPLNIVLFLTLHCNARCTMCNLRDIINKGQNEMPFERIKSFTQEIKPFKPSIILFGGEPLIRRDFVEIAKTVKDAGLSCGMFTNGTLFTPEIVRKIVELKMEWIAFSMQGLEETHDKIVGIKGAFRNMVSAIEEFNKHPKRKTKIIIHTTISEQNIQELGKIIELGERLNVDLIRIGNPVFFTDEDIRKNKVFMHNMFPDAKVEEINYSYDPTEKTEIFYQGIKDLMMHYKGRFELTPDLSLDEIKDWYSPAFKTKRKCLFVYRSLFIYPNGDVVPCENFKFVMGNINKEPFLDIWNSPNYVKFRKGLRKSIYPGCARCCKL